VHSFQCINIGSILFITSAQLIGFSEGIDTKNLIDYFVILIISTVSKEVHRADITDFETS
jgi:hypothetical protein